jgi:hypothetical protein
MLQTLEEGAIFGIIDGALMLTTLGIFSVIFV